MFYASLLMHFQLLADLNSVTFFVFLEYSHLVYLNEIAAVKCFWYSIRTLQSF